MTCLEGIFFVSERMPTKEWRECLKGYTLQIVQLMPINDYIALLTCVTVKYSLMMFGQIIAKYFTPYIFTYASFF